MLLSRFFNPEDGGDTFLRNVCFYKTHILEDGILLSNKNLDDNCFVSGFFYPEDGGDTFLRNVPSYKTHIPDAGILLPNINLDDYCCQRHAMACF
jgi:hypothetical protein